MGFSEFDMLLDASRGGEGREQPWTEEARQRARAELARFDETDWRWLERQWRSRPKTWKRLFAGLAHPSQTYARLLPFLVDVVLATDDGLALEGALALERLVDKLRVLRPHPMDYSLALPGRLDDLMDEPAAPARPLARLKQRLERTYSL